MNQKIHKILMITNDKIEILFELNNSNIILTIKEIINANINEEFKGTFTYETLKKMSNYYVLFDNIKEIYEDIVNHLEKKEYDFTKENNKLSLIIKSKVGIKEIEIPIICQKNIINENDQNKNEKISLCSDIKKENVNEIKIIKEKLNLMENNFNKIFKFQENTENNMNKIIEILNKFNNAEKDNFFNIPSLICNQKNEIEFLKNLLPNRKLTLLYSATKDGDSSNIFHSKCDNQGETLTLCETIEGRKFGGHMNQSMATKSDWFNQKDGNFFLFSLNRLRWYRPINDYYYNNGCFHSNYNQGPIFGNGNSNIGVYYGISILCKDGGTEFEIKDMGIDEKYLFSGKSKFTVKELEVYKVQ